MAELVCLVPVLNRPERVEPLVRSFYSSLGTIEGRLLFLASPDDEAEHEQLAISGEDTITMLQPAAPGDYAHKMNVGAAITSEEWLFLGADDLCFCHGWAELAIAHAERHGKTVVGTNDLGNPSVMRGQHATHNLLHRSYVPQGTVDDPGRLLHEGYQHNWVDNEFVETARARGQWGWCRESRVEHLHPHWRKGTMDATYERGIAGYAQDARLFRQRQPLWSRSRVPGRGAKQLL